MANSASTRHPIDMSHQPDTAFVDSERFDPLVDSTSLLNNPDALRRRAADDGYLFFRGLLPVNEVMQVRRDMLRTLDRIGWRTAGQNDLGGTLNTGALPQVPESAMRTDIGVPIETYNNTQCLESMHRLPHHPAIVGFYRRFFGREVLVHPRHIAWMITSHPCMVPTPPHQDFPLIQGTTNTWTMWIPLGDCPRSMGGLAVLRGSHRKGYLPIQPSRGAGGIAVPLCPSETEWLTTDYAAGDVLTFPCFTLHRGTRSRRPDQIRLSLDVRFQPIDEEVESRSLQPHCELTWEQIYAGWKSNDLKYYWRSLPLKLAGWDDSLKQPKRRIC